jgi:hypothetical protein
MALLETHVRPACLGIGALGWLRLASIRGSPRKLNIVAPSVKKSTYFEPMIRLSAGFPLAWLTDEVADNTLFPVDVAMSVTGATAVAVVEAANTSAAVLDAVDEAVELAVSGSAIATPSPVDVACVDVAVRAETKLVSKAQRVRLVRTTLATENAITLFFFGYVPMKGLILSGL